MRQVRLLFVAVAALSLWGCGGGSASNSNTNADPLVSGRAALNRVASGQQTASTQTLQSIFNQFLQALQSAPNSPEAHFGAAICLAGMVGEAADGTTETPPAPPEGGGVTNTPPRYDGELPPAPPNTTTTPTPVPPHRMMGLIWNLDRGLSNPLVLMRMLGPVGNLQFGLLPYYGYRQDDVTQRQKMLDNLTSVAQHLETVEADKSFTYTLTGQDGQAVTIGLPEVYLFHAYVNSLRVEVALSLAYFRDAGTTQVVLPPSKRDANKDGKLTPDEYLPGHPFLTLRDGALLPQAKQALLDTADKASKGIEGVLARPETGNYLIPNRAPLHDALIQTRDTVLPVLRDVANGPVTLKLPRYEPAPLFGQPQTGGLVTAIGNKVWELPPPAPGTDPSPQPNYDSVKVNLAAWFAHPPADLKPFAPTYTLDNTGWPDLSKTTYPDPTFGGLFPEGLPPQFRF